MNIEYKLSDFSKDQLQVMAKALMTEARALRQHVVQLESYSVDSYTLRDMAKDYRDEYALVNETLVPVFTTLMQKEKEERIASN